MAVKQKAKSANEVTSMKEALMNMRVFGKDKFSAMKLPQLLSCDGVPSNVMTQMEDLARAYVERNPFACWTSKTAESALRWHLRGCCLAFAVRRAQVDVLRYSDVDTNKMYHLRKTFSGRDDLSNMPLDALRDLAGLTQEDGERTFAEVHANLNGTRWVFAPFDDSVIAQMWRWVFRGMSLREAAEKVWVGQLEYARPYPPESEFV